MRSSSIACGTARSRDDVRDKHKGFAAREARHRTIRAAVAPIISAILQSQEGQSGFDIARGALDAVCGVEVSGQPP